ncbi:hypothetical protein [uncultured Methanobrevibacter sp.]|uniref:hypothetical protein n=1 Tax=uncultured Methanobrevibacter sp. TaxID=253161 RepID=UPI0025D77A05|nr:hypothetical protein [uncultured Methanobrevibacter sp.]
MFNPEEYFPKEEIDTLKQVYYLIILFLLFIFILFSFLGNENSRFFALIEVLFMVNIALGLEYNTWKNKLLFFLIIPYEALSFLIVGDVGYTILSLINYIHVPILIYLMYLIISTLGNTLKPIV